MKSSPSIWRYVVSGVKSTMKISSICVAFLENMNFKTSKIRMQSYCFCIRAQCQADLRAIVQ